MENIIEILKKKTTPLQVLTNEDDFTKLCSTTFDCNFNGVSTFYPWEMPTKLPNDYNIGVIYGKSGSGKSTLLKQFGTEITPIWDKDKAIISHFNNPEDGINKLGAVGLNTIPSWFKPYHVLSNGEKFRADLSKKLNSNVVIDEFTSVVDRKVAKATSVSISKYIKQNNLKNIVISTCHDDILDWLEPDWVINTDTGEVYNNFFLKDQISISKYIQQIAISGQCLKNITI